MSNFSEVYVLLSIEGDEEKQQELVGSKSHMVRTITETGKVVKNCFCSYNGMICIVWK